MEPASVAEQWAADPAVEPWAADPAVEPWADEPAPPETATETAAAGPGTDAEPAAPEPVAEPDPEPEPAAASEPVAAPDPEPEPAAASEPVAAPDPEPEPAAASEPAAERPRPATSAERRRPAPRPAGVEPVGRDRTRATTDTTEDAETTEATATRPRAGLAGVPLLVVLVLVALVCASAAALFRGQAARAGDDSGAGNAAVVDTAATSEVVGQVSKAIETVLSYDHTRLDANEAAGREVVTGRYADEFGRTFDDVRRTAPEQKLVLTTTVLLAGVTLIEGDRAEVIATMDLAAIRDTTPYNSPGRVKVVAIRVDGRWKIAEMTLL